MTLILQWTALAACLACTAWRLPAMLRGRNRSLFWIFAMTSVCVGLSIPAIYLPVDALLGGINIANAILRVSLFAVFFLLASKIAAAYNSPLARKMIRGPVGIAVLVFCSVGIWTTFLFSNKGPSSAGLSDVEDHTLLTVYGWFGMAYMVYAAACVVGPTAKAAFSRRPALDRTSALLMSIGFALVLLTVPIQLLPNASEPLMGPVSFSAVLFVAAGMALVWVSFIRRPMAAPAQAKSATGTAAG